MYSTHRIQLGCVSAPQAFVRITRDTTRSISAEPAVPSAFSPRLLPSTPTQFVVDMTRYIQMGRKEVFGVHYYGLARVAASRGYLAQCGPNLTTCRRIHGLQVHLGSCPQVRLVCGLIATLSHVVAVLLVLSNHIQAVILGWTAQRWWPLPV